MSDHAGSHGRIRQRPGGGGHVFPHMIDAGGRRNGAGHGRMRNDELENDLRPARAADLRGPAGQRIASDLSEQLAFAKRPVDDHADTAVPRQRKDALFDLAVENVVTIFGLVAVSFGPSGVFLSIASMGLLAALALWFLMPETRPSTDQ